MEDYERLELEAENFLNIISQNIEKIREEKGMTKLDVSRKLGFMVADYYSKMELRANGKHFNLKHLYKLSKILNVPITDFCENKN